jgi:hypothetical protein
MGYRLRIHRVADVWIIYDAITVIVHLVVADFCDRLPRSTFLRLSTNTPVHRAAAGPYATGEGSKAIIDLPIAIIIDAVAPFRDWSARRACLWLAADAGVHHAAAGSYPA